MESTGKLIPNLEVNLLYFDKFLVKAFEKNQFDSVRLIKYESGA